MVAGQLDYAPSKLVIFLLGKSNSVPVSEKSGDSILTMSAASASSAAFDTE